MLSLKIKKPKIEFFGRQVIRSNWKKLAKNPLSKFGTMVARNAKSEIGRLIKRKTTKPRPSPNAPRMRNPGKQMKMIFSVPNDMASVIVGMVGFGGPNPVPGLHEHGGTKRTIIWKNKPQSRNKDKKTGRFKKGVKEPIKSTVKIPKRQFMAPAFKRARAKIPPIWSNSLHK